MKKLKDRKRTAIAKIDQPFLQIIWHEVQYGLDVCRATNEINIGLL